MSFYTYIVQCKDKSLYTGYTTKLDERIATHNRGAGAKYTRSRRPVKLLYYEIWLHKKDAMASERRIKKLSRNQKLTLIKESTEPNE